MDKLFNKHKNRASSTINIVTDPNALILNNSILSNTEYHTEKILSFLISSQTILISFAHLCPLITIYCILFYSYCNSFFIFIIKFNKKKEEKNLSG